MQTTNLPKTHNLVFLSPMRVIQIHPASYMLLNEYILHICFFFLNNNTEKIERKIKQAKRYNNRYPATRKDQQTSGFKSSHYKYKVDNLCQLANKTKTTKQT